MFKSKLDLKIHERTHTGEKSTEDETDMATLKYPKM